MEPFKVGMAEYKVAPNPNVLTSIGLGSCVGIVLYDANKKIGGLAHIMLPRRDEGKERHNPAKFADSAIQIMLNDMMSAGATPAAIRAKIFGGANMFPGVPTRTGMNVGQRNAQTVKEELAKRKIKIVAEDLGGTMGRTVVFDTTDGSVVVRDVRGGSRTY